MQRKIPIEDKNFQKLIDQKYDILNEGQQNAKEAQKLQDRNKELEQKLNPLKEKLLNKMNKKEEKLDLGEYEILETTEKDEEGNYNLVVKDRLEEFKEWFKNNSQNYEQGSDKTNS